MATTQPGSMEPKGCEEWVCYDDSYHTNWPHLYMGLTVSVTVSRQSYTIGCKIGFCKGKGMSHLLLSRTCGLMLAIAVELQYAYCYHLWWLKKYPESPGKVGGRDIAPNERTNLHSPRGQSIELQSLLLCWKMSVIQNITIVWAGRQLCITPEGHFVDASHDHRHKMLMGRWEREEEMKRIPVDQDTHPDQYLL